MKLEGRDKINGSTAVLGSNLSPSLNLEWNAHCSESLWFDLGFQYQKLELAQASSRSLVGQEKTITKFYLGTHYQASDLLELEMQFGQSENIYCRSINATALQIEKTPVMYSQWGLGFYPFRSPSMRIGLRAGYRTLMPTKTDYLNSSWGSGYRGSFQLERKLKRFGLAGSLFFQSDTLPDPAVEFKTVELGLSLGINYPL